MFRSAKSNDDQDPVDIANKLLEEKKIDRLPGTDNSGSGVPTGGNIDIVLMQKPWIIKGVVILLVLPMVIFTRETN